MNIRYKFTIIILILINLGYFIAVNIGGKHADSKRYNLNFSNTQDLSDLRNISANAGCVIANKEGKLLMARGEEIKKYHIPGGTAVAGESVVDTAKREAFEELGVVVDVVSLLTIMENPRFYLFLCRAEGRLDMNYSYPGEIDKIAWIDPAKEEKNNLRFGTEYIQISASVKDAVRSGLISEYLYD